MQFCSNDPCVLDYNLITSDEAVVEFAFIDQLKTINEEELIWDTYNLIGSVGGILGLWVGFSFFNIFEILVDFIYRKMYSE